MVTQTGDRTASVQKHVVEASKREQGLAPIPLRLMAEKTVALLEPRFLQGNAILTHALVR